MANRKFHNNTVDINHMWYRSHKELIKQITRELGVVDKTDELIDMFLGTETKFKKHKDPNAPKRPKTGFLLFCDEFRDDIKKKNKELQMCDVMKELGKLWGTYSDVEKEQFNLKYRDARSEYEEQIEEYNMNYNY
jgi:hypothetical protein